LVCCSAKTMDDQDNLDYLEKAVNSGLIEDDSHMDNRKSGSRPSIYTYILTYPLFKLFAFCGQRCKGKITFLGRSNTKSLRNDCYISKFDLFIRTFCIFLCVILYICVSYLLLSYLQSASEYFLPSFSTLKRAVN